MIFGSLFSGIEAASAAWLPLGWRCAWVAEIDPFACAVLRHHYPDVPNLGDVNRIDPDAIEPVDLVVFGSPCQSFSVAGKRLGLDDPRGNMALVGLRLIGKLRSRWVVWENVPGILSSDGGRDFGAFLGLLAELGYGFAYTVLDAQHAGVPQRRRRVFVVGYLGDWRPPAAVLFESESLRWNPPPSREAGERIARPVASCAEGGSGYRCDADTADSLIAFDARNGTLSDETIPVQAGGDCKRGYSLNTIPLAFGGNNTAGPIEVATACNAHGGPHGRLDFETETLIASTVAPPVTSNPYGDHESREGLLIAFSAKDYGADAGDTAPTLRAGAHTTSHANAGVMPAIAFQANAGRDFTADEDRSPPLRSEGIGGTGGVAIAFDITGTGPGVRNGAAETGIHSALRSRAPGHSEGSTTTVIAHALRADGFDASEDGTGRGTPLVAAFTVSAQANGFSWETEVAPAIQAHPQSETSQRQYGIRQGMSVRRLLPIETERLQGLPDNYTLVPYRGKPAADGNRYRAIGNSMAVPVIRWLGRRIQQVEDTIRETTDAEA